MPTKQLPQNAHIDHLKYQARDLLKAHAVRDARAAQRIREFHPRLGKASDAAIFDGKFTLSDAQLSIAREHGFNSWMKLRQQLEKPGGIENLSLPHHERIQDPAFRRAVDLMDSGDAEGLRDHLLAHPGVVHQRVAFEGGNYFRNPSLLEFAAENPVRNRSLPGNIVQVAKVIIDAGAGADLSILDGTLALVCSGSVTRACGVQLALIDLLCDSGAGPNRALPAALGHGEFDAVKRLLERGAEMNLATAAATGRTAEAGGLLGDANAEERHRALALAAQFGHTEIVRLLVEAGEDPNRYNPPGTHSHSTPLHQAALAGHMEVVRFLVERGAGLDTKDALFQGTPADWAEFAGRHEVAAYLRTQAKQL